MQKARRLMEENSVSFQMFLILLSSITLGLEKPNLRVQARSEQYLEACFILLLLLLFFFVRGEHAQKPKFGSEKKNFIRHFARFNFWRLSLAFILKYYPILHAVKR